jgi:putative aminopeptidase FrvX
MHYLLFAVLLLSPVAALANTAQKLQQLIDVPGVPGYEARVREAVEMLLPSGARVRADNLGNIVLRTGNGAPHTLIVAPLDEVGFVVSAVTEDGYLRVHRPGPGPAVRLWPQFFVGQPIHVLTAAGARVPGVTATPSSHLRSFHDQAEDARLKTIDDIWIDVGAESRVEVEKLGIRLLDSITLRDRGHVIAGGRVSGVAAVGRASALALAELVRRSPGRGAKGSVTLAWVTQSEFGNRGLLRLLETMTPDRLIVLGSAPSPAEHPRGAIGDLGAGPIVRDGGVNLPAKWKELPTRTVHVPVLFAQTPVETVAAQDVDALAEWIAAEMGLPPLAPVDRDGGPSAVTAVADGVRGGGTAVVDGGRGTEVASRGRSSSPGDAGRLDPFDTLAALIETYGVSGHEAAVREQIAKRLPAWAKPEVDSKGNLLVRFGNGGRPLVFVAHMDEVGFEISDLAPDGTAVLRSRGGMYASLWEAHPVIVQTGKGPIPAIMAPRPGYTTAKTAQPDRDALYVYFGTSNEAETTALGVVAGQSVTIRKQFMRLGSQRATGRAMDDRAGSTALLLALSHIDPKSIQNEVTFAWVVEEETGLEGAAHLAANMAADTAFAVDTFVSTDTPVDIQRLAGAKLGHGAVLRILDSRTIVPPHVVDRIVAIAKEDKIPLQLGTTSGGTDSSAFSAGGAIDAGLSWPGRYSHSPVEVIDARDLDALVQPILSIARHY